MRWLEGEDRSESGRKEIEPFFMREEKVLLSLYCCHI
jgi:hypothetical protein